MSVIIPTYNRKTLLLRALNSVFLQTRVAHEIIVVDDASSDGTASMLRTQFPDVITLQHKKNLGVSAARNKGIKKASGNWLAFLDSDDEWLPHKLEAQSAALIQASQKGYNYKLVHSNEIWFKNGRHLNPMKKHQKKGGMIFQACLPLCALSPSTVMLHKSLIDSVGYFDEKLPACEDYDLWLRICLHHPVLLVEQALIHRYGGHDDQLSKKYWGMDRFRIQSLHRLLSEQKLDKVDREVAIEMLIKKIKVYIKGAEKRHKTDEVHFYNTLLTQYRDA
ncbi:MAG: glycosyltransferase family 2 protein [Gammaproteobacteria bacterium]|nr:glycosyltransferase family 2 protein [Gammaproteobacteria bacterium]